MTENQELSSLLRDSSSENLDPIFLRIAEDESFGIGPGDVSMLIEFGKIWWFQKRPEVQKLICGNERIRGFVSGDEKELASYIFELLVGTFLPSTAAKLSAICVRTGISVLCKTQWEEQ